MRKAKIGCLAALLLLLWTTGAWADAFNMPESQFLGRFGVHYFTSTQFRDDDGKLQTYFNDMYYRDVAGFGELAVGVTETIELDVNLIMGWQHLTGDDGLDETNWALRDINLGVQWMALGGNRAALSLAGGMKLPFFYDKGKDLPAGDGQIDFDGRLLAAVRFSLFTAGIDGGYRLRLDDPANVWIYGAEVNFAYSIVFGGARLNGETAAGEADDEAEWNFFYQGPEYDRLTGNLNLGVFFAQHWALEFQTLVPISGRNVASGPTYRLALLYRY
ncbi:MAG TPA: hypothetical protein PKW95_10675 [bacterium]|nr:hypothetical protein [bacterium]